MSEKNEANLNADSELDAVIKEEPQETCSDENNEHVHDTLEAISMFIFLYHFAMRTKFKVIVLFRTEHNLHLQYQTRNYRLQI